MKDRSLAALVTLNLVILGVLAVTLLAPAPAPAQFGAAANEYMMVAGSIRNRSQQDVVYILNVNQGALAGVIYDSNRQALTSVDVRRINQDISR